MPVCIKIFDLLYVLFYVNCEKPKVTSSNNLFCFTCSSSKDNIITILISILSQSCLFLFLFLLHTACNSLFNKHFGLFCLHQVGVGCHEAVSGYIQSINH